MVNLPLPPKGRVMGHEGTGMVAMLGAGVTTDSLGKPLGEGDRVVYYAVFPCYRCHLCLRGDTNWCVNRAYPCCWHPPLLHWHLCGLPLPGRHGTLYSRCRMSCPMSFLGHSIAPWEPLPKA